MNRWEIWFHRAFGLLILSLGLWFGLDRAIPVEQIENVVINGPVRAGTDAVVRSSVVRHRSCPVKLERAVFDASGLRFRFDDISFTRAGKLGTDTFLQKVRIPAASSAGPGRIQFVISWTCNPLQWLMPIAIEVNMPLDILSASGAS